MKIKSIVCKDFRAFEDQTFEFGSVNYIEGDNYQGKTSISEAIVALLLGTTLSGSPQITDLIRNGAKKFELTGIIEADGEEHEIYRSRDSRKTTLQLDRNPATQAEIDRFIGAKERFLTVFSPGYFAGLTNPVAREMLVGLTKRPRPEEIIALLPAHAERLMFNGKPLAELRDPDAFAKSIRSDIKSNEAERNRIDGRIQAFHEQLRAEAPVVPEFDGTRLAEARTELEQLKSRNKVAELNMKASELSNLKRQLASIRLQDVPDAPYIYGQPCPVCKQPLGEDALNAALEHHLEHVEQLEDSNAEKLIQQIELQERIDALSSELSEPTSKDDDDRMDDLAVEIRALEMLEYQQTAGKAKLEQHLKAVESAAASISKSEIEKVELEKESFALGEQLKAIGAFRQELVKVQVGSITQHLKRVGIELFKITQDGEIKDDFVLTYDGKDYKVLSTSERIRVNLEIASLFNTVLGLDFPVFIDNAESITHYEQPNTTQIFLAKVVEGSELKLEVEAE